MRIKLNDSLDCTGLHFNEGSFRFKYLPTLLINCHGFKYYFSMWWWNIRWYKF